MTYIYVIHEFDNVSGATTDQAAAYAWAIDMDENIGIFPDAAPQPFPVDSSVGWFGRSREGRTYFSKDGRVHMPESAIGTLTLLDLHDGEQSKYYEGDAAVRKARELIYLERGGIS